MATQTVKHWRRWQLSTPALAWLVLAINSIVILQGAFVRITRSGDGCGQHWPTCHGELIPIGHGVATMIEFGHRLLSLAALVGGVWLLRRGLKVRRELPGFYVMALWSFIFLIIEALLGAVTVLFGLTGDNLSFARGMMVSSHLVNSLLLMGALTLTIIYASPRANQTLWPLRFKGQGLVTTVLLVGLVGMLLLMFSGGIAAVANKIAPTTSLAEGLAADFNPESHPLVRLRILHPLLGITVGIYLFLSLGLSRWLKPVASARNASQALFVVYLLQLVIGTANLAFLTPMVLQLLHLALAVVAFCLLTAVCGYTLADRAEVEALAQRAWRAKEA